MVIDIWKFVLTNLEKSKNMKATLNEFEKSSRDRCVPWARVSIITYYQLF